LIRCAALLVLVQRRRRRFVAQRELRKNNKVHGRKGKCTTDFYNSLPRVIYVF
jgi:hypothetical protein